MPFDPKHGLIAFEKLDRHLNKLARKAAPESVHRFRTYSRRVQALLEELAARPSGNQKKLLKALNRLRKKAGRVRDLDVQIAALRSLRIPQASVQKAQLMRGLVEDRAKREKKLASSFDKKSVSELRKRIKRAVRTTDMPNDFDPLARAVRSITRLGKERTSVSEDTLHRYRIEGKRARYLAEMGDGPEAERVVTLLKRMQDGIGDWHDWLKLSQKAEEHFGGVQDSALVAALRNITQAKFRHAATVLEETRAVFAGKPPVGEKTLLPKRAAGMSQSGSAA